MLQTFLPKSISSHFEPRTSLVRAAVKMRNSKASFVISASPLALQPGNERRDFAIGQGGVMPREDRLPDRERGKCEG